MNMTAGRSISFIEDSPVFTKERPYVHVSSTKQVPSTTNCNFYTHTPFVLTDYRDRKDKEDLRTNGFAFIHWPLSYPQFEETSQSTTPSPQLIAYLDSARLFIEEFLQATSTVVFDWRVCYPFIKWSSLQSINALVLVPKSRVSGK